jgi:hypothetical protein
LLQRNCKDFYLVVGEVPNALVKLFALVFPLDLQAVVAADACLSILAHGRLVVRFLNYCVPARILEKWCKVLRIIHFDVDEIVQGLDGQSVLVSFAAFGRELEKVPCHFLRLSFERFAFLFTVVVILRPFDVVGDIVGGGVGDAPVSGAAAFCFCDLVVMLDTAVVSAMTAALDSSSAMFTLAPNCAPRSR